MRTTIMKGYFKRKPESIQEVLEAKHWGAEEVQITSVGEVNLSASQYRTFCEGFNMDYDFLVPYAEKACFSDDGAKCVMITSPGQQTLAVCLEGYAYPRYVAALNRIQ